MQRAIKAHMRDFVALIVLFLIAVGVSAFILGHERLYLPKWVPGVGADFYHVNAEFSTAQAVVPGQGQTVDVAGVPVGEIGSVDLKNGVAIVKLNIRRKYAPIYRDAHMLLRPKTGLKDMIVEMDPGNPSAGKLPDGGTIPIQNTAPDVNLDEILSSLDRDTRDYLAILVQSGGEALSGPGTPAQLRATLLRFEPTNRDLAKITGLLSKRRQNLAHVIHNFSLLTNEVGKRDTQLAALVGSANANFRALANQEANISQTVALLPDTLTTARNTLVKADAFAKELGPTAQALQPWAQALGPSLAATRPFLRTTTPVIKTQLRPFAVDVQPTVEQLRIAAKYLKPLTPQLTSTFRVINKLLNTLAYNPPGEDEGYLFWASWVNHAAATVFGTQDAQGAIRRGSIVTSCDSLSLLQQVGAINPALSVLLQLLNPPDFTKVCPQPVPAAKRRQHATGKSAAPAPKTSKAPGLPASPTPPKPVITPGASLGGGG